MITNPSSVGAPGITHQNVAGRSTRQLEMNRGDARIFEDEVVGGVATDRALRAQKRQRRAAVLALRDDEPPDRLRGSLNRAPVHLGRAYAFRLLSGSAHGSLTTRLILAPGFTSREKVFEPSPSRETSIRWVPGATARPKWASHPS